MGLYFVHYLKVVQVAVDIPKLGLIDLLCCFVKKCLKVLRLISLCKQTESLKSFYWLYLIFATVKTSANCTKSDCRLSSPLPTHATVEAPFTASTHVCCCRHPVHTQCKLCLTSEEVQLLVEFRCFGLLCCEVGWKWSLFCIQVASTGWVVLWTQLDGLSVQAAKQ